MELKTFFYSQNSGWSVPHLPELDSPNSLLLAFADSDFIDNPKPFSELKSTYPRSIIMGCSTAGEIFGQKVSDKTIAVAVIRFEKTPLLVATSKIKAGDFFTAGLEIAKALVKPDLKGIFILSEGLKINASEVLRGVNSVVPSNVTVTGGLAADKDRFKRTWVLVNGKPEPGWVSAVGFYGDNVSLQYGCQGGWDIFGLQRIVTKSSGNVLYELDKSPALELYKKYLGERASGLPATALLFPLALRSQSTDDKYLVRTVLAVNEGDKSMTFAGDIPQGYVAQLMRANFDRLVDGAIGAAHRALSGEQKNTKSPILAIAISCLGRRLVLGERTEEEIEATLETLPSSAQQVGFYSYGEISPWANGRSDLQNQTMTLTTITEE